MLYCATGWLAPLHTPTDVEPNCRATDDGASPTRPPFPCKPTLLHQGCFAEVSATRNQGSFAAISGIRKTMSCCAV